MCHVCVCGCIVLCRYVFVDDPAFVPIKERVRLFFQRWPGAMQAGNKLFACVAIVEHRCKVLIDIILVLNLPG